MQDNHPLTELRCEAGFFSAYIGVFHAVLTGLLLSSIIIIVLGDLCRYALLVLKGMVLKAFCQGAFSDSLIFGFVLVYFNFGLIS